MMSFVTRWSEYFGSPIVEVFTPRSTKRVALVVPLTYKTRVDDQNGVEIKDHATRAAEYVSDVKDGLESGKCDLTTDEVRAVMSYLTNEKNFSEFDELMSV